MSLSNILLVGLGAAIGGIVRYLASVFIQSPEGAFPWATLLVNVAGSFIIGILLFYYTDRNTLSEASRLFLTVGFCGGFTTFSTFSAETIQLFQLRHELLAFVYICSSVVASLGATYAGLAIARSF